ncbi:hypothetical protein [Streptomyces colonosanans]|uniref:Uncharacterized protein n=1 Tax=Streptomyces colonosanans TaxID=1428652 RepID=A0A1S2PA62_9ACTN|nr:hypothetical protein [Streptomyces colonosanans]OIJ90265.1 hypothetical protein BIV24_18225 [Streptomyces colonosanans]
MAAEYDGADALMAAITGEPLPDGAHADAAFMAEHRSARDDVALLREQLGIIGDALAEQEPGPRAEPVRVPRPRRTWMRHPGAWSLGVLVAAAVTATVLGMGWLVAQNPVTGSADASSKRAAASDRASGYLACARLVVEGRVTDVRGVPGSTRERITLAVDRHYVPATGEGEVTFLMDRDTDPRPHKGEHVLVGILGGSKVPDLWVTGEEDIAGERAWILQGLPPSGTARCGT